MENITTNHLMRGTGILLALILCLFLDYSYAADSLPINPNIETPQSDADESTLGFKVVGHYSETYVQHLEVNEARKLAFLSFVATRPEKSGVRIIDFSSPSKPRLVGTYFDDGIVYSIRGNNSGTLIYLCSRNGPWGRLQIINIEKPESPTVIGNAGCGSESKIIGLSNAEDKIYLLDENTFLILDIKNPREVRQIGHSKLGNNVKSIWVSPTNKFAYFSNENGLNVLHFDNPDKMRISALLHFDNSPYSVSPRSLVSNQNGGLVYFGSFSLFNSRGGFSIAKITAGGKISSEKPPLLDFEATGVYEMQLRGADSRLYAMTSEQGLVEINVSNPDNPELNGTMHIPLSKLIINFGTGDFFISHDEKYLFVPITVRKGEDIKDVGGLTIYSRK